MADVSTISGLDFPDDARAVAPVDWDLDGDLDLWVANRSGPQIRFLRNDVPTNYHYVALRLEGRTCNRDAIGARVQLTLGGKAPGKFTKTIRAGDGYLSQGSKWLHFGIGHTSAIAQLEVRWPGGEIERFRGLVPDSRYRIVQGSGKAQPWQMPDREVRLIPSELHAPAASGRTQTFLASRLPMPPLTYLGEDGSSNHVTAREGRPLLLKLWASWCPLCMGELKEVTSRQDELRMSGLDILALCVDGIDDGTEGSPETRRECGNVLRNLKYPFPHGMATGPLLDILQITLDQLFDRHVPLPLPASVLIDGEGQLAAIYKGPLDVDRLIIDLGKLPLSGQQQRHAALDLSGRWLSTPARISLVPLFHDLVREGYRQEAIQLAASNPDRFPPSIFNADLLVADGDRLFRIPDLESAERQYRQALSLDPAHVGALIKLGTVLQRRADMAEAEAKFRAALTLDADNVSAHFLLGVLQKTRGRIIGSHSPFSQGEPIAAGPYADLVSLMAELLATDPNPENRDGARAVVLAEKVAQSTKYRRADVLAILAAAYAENADYQKAVETVRQAIPLSRAAENHELTRELEAKLDAYSKQLSVHSRSSQ